MPIYRQVLEQSLERNDQGFKLLSTQRAQSGSALSWGIFIDKYEELWAGKSVFSAWDIWRESVGQRIYAYYGAHVPRIAISLQEITVNMISCEPDPQEAYKMYQDILLNFNAGKSHALHFLSRWVDRFHPYGYCPLFKGGEKFYLSIKREADREKVLVAERGLGRILAIAQFINDVDVIGGSGGNIGYHIVSDAEGQISVESSKIDPGCVFNNVEQEQAMVIVEPQRIAAQLPIEEGGGFYFKNLPSQTQRDFLEAVRDILNTPIEDINRFFNLPGTDILWQNVEEEGMHPTKNRLQELLTRRRCSMWNCYEKILLNVVNINSNLLVTSTAFNTFIQQLCRDDHIRYTKLACQQNHYFYVIPDDIPFPNSGSRSSLFKSLSDFLEAPDYKVWLLLGDSGSGKSCSTYEWVQSIWKCYTGNVRDWVPIHVEFKNFSEQTVKRCIFNYLQDRYHLSEEDLEAILNRHRLLIIVDGFDEIPGKAKFNVFVSHQLQRFNTKLIITCRSNCPAIEKLELFYPPQEPKSLKVSYIAPFGKEQITAYLQTHSLSIDEKLIEENFTIFSNPFLLRLSMYALPQLERKFQLKSPITRYELYSSFLTQWFNSQQARLSIIFDALLPKQLIESFQYFSSQLALKMHKYSVERIQATNEIWKPFFQEDKDNLFFALLGCPLRIIDHYYSFTHKSYQDFFVAQAYYSALLEKNFTSLQDCWNDRLLSEEPGVIEFLLEAIEKGCQLQQTEIILQLEQLILASRTCSACNIFASNAATILVAYGTSFSGKDLSYIKISGADLTGIIADGTNFTYADLSNTCLHNAVLRHAKLINCQLKNTDFGQRPWLRLDSSIIDSALSSNGKWIALLNENANIQLFGLEKDYFVKVLDGHMSNVTNITFSADSCWLVVAESKNKSICLWNIKNSKYDNIFYSHAEDSCSLALSSDNCWLASAHKDNTLYLWNTDIKKCVHTFKEHKYLISCVVFSPNNHWLVYGGLDSIRVWDLKKEQHSYIFKTPFREVTCLTFSKDSRWLALGSRAGVVCLWDFIVEKYTHTLYGHTLGITNLAFSSNSHFLASASFDHTIRIWEIESGKENQILRGHTDKVNNIIFSHDGDWITSSSNDKTIRFWKVDATISRDKVRKRSVARYINTTKCIVFNKNGNLIASGGEDKVIYIWDSEYGKELYKLIGHTRWIRSLAFSQDSQILISVSGDETMCLWNLKQSKCICTIKNNAYCISFNSDGSWLISGNKDSKILLWNVAQGKCIQEFRGHSGAVQSVAFSFDNKHIVSGSEDGTIRLWDIEKNKCIYIFKGHTDVVCSVVFSTDSAWIASGGKDHTVRLWDIKMEKCCFILSGHLDTVNRVLFTSDNRQLISGSDDKTVRFWSTESGYCLQVLTFHCRGIKDITFSSSCTDDELLAVAAGTEIAAWSINNKDNYRPKLKWTNLPHLDLENCDIKKAKNLSIFNQTLINQQCVRNKTKSFVEYTAQHQLITSQRKLPDKQKLAMEINHP